MYSLGVAAPKTVIPGGGGGVLSSAEDNNFNLLLYCVGINFKCEWTPQATCTRRIKNQCTQGPVHIQKTINSDAAPYLMRWFQFQMWIDTRSKWTTIMYSTHQEPVYLGIHLILHKNDYKNDYTLRRTGLVSLGPPGGGGGARSLARIFSPSLARKSSGFCQKIPGGWSPPSPPPPCHTPTQL